MDGSLNDFNDLFVESALDYIRDRKDVKRSHDGSYYLQVYNFKIDFYPYNITQSQIPSLIERWKEIGVNFYPFMNQFSFGKDELEELNFELSWRV